MEILTSISPRHYNQQAQSVATATWSEGGYKPVSLNAPNEVDRSAYPNVKFVDTDQTMKGVMKAGYVMISAFLDHAIKSGAEHLVLMNSDIAIAESIDQLVDRSSEGLVFANRHDHNGDFANPTPYLYGFDAFIIHRKYFDLIPRSMFCMGQTWWDYWLPYRFIMAGVPVQLASDPIFLHHRHPVQYDSAEWQRMTDHFCFMEGYPKRQASSITGDVYRKIKAACVSI